MKFLFINKEINRYNWSTKKPKRGTYISFEETCKELEKLRNTVSVVYKNEESKDKYDVAISLRDPAPLETVKASIKILWLQDLFCYTRHYHKKIYNLLKKDENVKVIFLSKFHKNDWHKIVENFDNQRFWIIPQAARTYLVSKKIKQKRFVYTSAPHRGLLRLLNYWKHINDELRDYSLHIASGPDLYMKKEEINTKINIKEYLKLINQKNIVWHRNLYDKSLYDLISSSKALLYPCHKGETGCVSLFEALSCNCIPVVPNQEVFPELVKNNYNGILIDGNPKNDIFMKEFVKKVINTTKNNYWEKLAKNTPAVEEISWENRARLLKKMCSNLLK